MTWHLDDDHLWRLVCDNCGDGWHEWAIDIRFASGPELVAFAQLNGWVLTQDREICSACSLARECGRVGHVWGLWTQLEPSPLSADGIARRVRFCDVCTAGEYNPPFRRRAE